MKNGILSRSDVVEIMAKKSKSCSWWRSYFKRYGWKWNIIWYNAAKEGFIRLGYLYCNGLQYRQYTAFKEMCGGEEE